MPDDENAIILLRALRGAPLTCLAALGLAGRPKPVSWLREATGYSAHTVADALRTLAELGLARHGARRSDWRLLPRGRRFWRALPSRGTGQSDLQADEEVETGEGAMEPESGAGPKRQSVGSRPTGPSRLPDAIVLKLLRESGIGEPMASLLAAMEHITPEYARAHIERARREHIGAGLLIHRMRSADPAPLTRAEEERQRYIGGEYADLILH